VILLVFLAVRHLHCKSESSCAKAKYRSGIGSTAVHGGCIIHDSSQPCETLVLKHCDEMNSTDRLFSAVVPDCIDVSSSLMSRHSSILSCAPSSTTSLIDITSESAVTSQRISAISVSQSDQLTVSESLGLHMSSPPSDRLSDIYLSDENRANIASNSVSVSATDTRTNSLLDSCCVVDISSQVVSCVKESSVARDLHSLQIDGVSALSSMMGVRNRVITCGQLPDINRIKLEAGKSVLEVNSSCSILEEHYTPLYVDSSSTSVCCLADCVLPNVAIATDSMQNGLSAVGLVSRFNSMTAMAKSQKTAFRRGRSAACFRYVQCT